jgi:sec-independent protein translocase protein TatB
MFDISWTEFLLIGVVALVVIGPKELPGVLRTLGQWTRKVRGMASDFQNQFHEAMREAEMADLKKQVDDMAHDIKSYDPLKSVREDVEAMGKDLETSVAREPSVATAAPEHAEALAAAEPAAVGALPEPAPVPVQEFPIPEAVAELRDTDVAGAATGPVTPESEAEATHSDSAGRTG